MRHRTVKYKPRITRKNPNKERIIDVKGNILDYGYLKKQQNKEDCRNLLSSLGNFIAQTKSIG